MHRVPVLVGVLAVAAVPTVASAQKQKPPKAPKGSAALTIAATPNPVVFGSNVTLDGKLSGVSPVAGVAVALEQDTTRPFGDAYAKTAVSATTTASGAWRIVLKPTRTTQYRVVAAASPPVTSPGRLVNVRPLVGLRVSTRTPRAGSLVRFSGIVQPARNGATALVQKRGSTGAFVTVARATLRAASTGSSYAVRTRVRRSGTYRVKLAGNGTFVNGFSRTVSLTTG